MNQHATRLRQIRSILAPVIALVADMGELTGRDETLAVLAALDVTPSIDLATFALGNNLDKSRFRRIAA